MLKKSFLLGLSMLLGAMLLTAVWPTSTNAQTNGGGENFIFVNYIGQEMILDLDDITYTVPGTDTTPDGGRLILTLPTGEHKFAANVPGGPKGFAGEFTVVSGDIVAKAARIDQTGPVVRDGRLLVPPKDFVFVFDFTPFAVPVAEIPVVDTWQPSVAAAQMSSIVIVNYIGEELTFDFSGTLYKVSPPANNIPGRLQIDVTPGTYRYTASVPAGSLNSEITIVAGQVAGLNITADPPPPRTYKVGEKFEILQPVAMKLFAEDLTSQARTVVAPTVISNDTAPLVLPETGGELAPVVDNLPAGADGLLIKNYAGDTLIFTINNQTFTIANNSEQTLNLPAGSYTYTGSIPYVATTGTIDLAPDRGVELSIAINVDHDFLNVYQN